MSQRITESLRPLSESGLWRLLTQFYSEPGLAVWRTGTVPHRVTSQGYLADAYAAVISAFDRDLREQGLEASPLIVEVGAGSGLFAWILLNRLRRHHASEKEPDHFEYLLTETSLDHAREWAQVARLGRLVEEGTLHLGALEVDGPAPSELTTLNGVRLDLRRRPLVLIANYVMDSLPCDLYRVRDGRLFNEHVAIDGCLQVDQGVPTLAEVSFEFESREVSPPYTGHAGVDQIVSEYRDLPGEACIPVSMAVVSFLDPFLESDAPLLVLAGDLAYTTSEFSADVPLVHDNYVACTANFHLLSRLFEQHGGSTRFTQHPDPTFSVGAFMKSVRPIDLPRAREAASVALGFFGAHDALNIEQALTEGASTLGFSQVTAWARLARYDAYATRLLLPHLTRIIEADESYDRDVLRDMLFEAFRLELPDVSDEDSLATRIAFLLFKAKMFQELMDFLALVSSEDEQWPECVHLGAVAAARLQDDGRALSLLADVSTMDRDYWNGWPTAVGSAAEVDSRSVLVSEDRMHCDHVALRMAIAEFRRIGALAVR